MLSDDEFELSSITFETCEGDDGAQAVWMIVDGEPFAEFTVEQAIELAEALQSAAWAATVRSAL